MKKSSGKKDRRRRPRLPVDLPLEYREINGFQFKGGITVNASEGGLLFESVNAIPLGAKLNVSVLFRKGFALAEVKLVAEVIRKEPVLREEWTGYQYGLNIVRLLDEDYQRLKTILDGQSGLEVTAVVQVPRYKVLVVDDEEGIRRLIVDLLSRRGHQCLQATDGVDALEKAATNELDAVITDIVMPKMNGITLTKELLKRTPKLPVMVMTGYDNEFSAVTALTSGAREFIRKPFSLAELAARFDKMMSAHEIIIGNEDSQNEALFQLQRTSLEETEKLKREIEHLTSRLMSGYPRSMLGMGSP